MTQREGDRVNTRKTKNRWQWQFTWSLKTSRVYWQEQGKQRGQGTKANGWREKPDLLHESPSPLKTNQAQSKHHTGERAPDQPHLSLEPSLKSHSLKKLMVSFPCSLLCCDKGLSKAPEASQLLMPMVCLPLPPSPPPHWGLQHRPSASFCWDWVSQPEYLGLPSSAGRVCRRCNASRSQKGKEGGAQMNQLPAPR